MGTTIQTILDLPTDFPVEDAEEELEIVVLPMHINKGRQRTPDGCAFALAERAVDSELVRVEALKTKLYLIYEDHAVRYLLHKHEKEAIAAFDDPTGKRMLPGIYKLYPVSPALQLGVQHTKKVRPTRDTGKRVKDAREGGSAWIRGREPEKKRSAIIEVKGKRR